MPRPPTRKELMIGAACIPVLLIIDQLSMSSEVSRGTQIVEVISSGFESGQYCTDGKRPRLICLADKLTSYHSIKMSSSPPLERALLEQRMNEFSKVQEARARKRIDEEYCLAMSLAFSRILAKEQDTDFFRPAELYARRAFLKQVREFLVKMKDVIEGIEFSYQEVGSTINMNRGDLIASFEGLKGAVSNEMNRSDITNICNSFLP